MQLPDTATNFTHPSTSRNTKLAKALNPSLQLPQRERIQYGYINHVSTTFAYSIHQASSQFLHSKRFPRFPISKLPTHPTPQLYQRERIRSAYVSHVS